MYTYIMNVFVYIYIYIYIYIYNVVVGSSQPNQERYSGIFIVIIYFLGGR